MTRNCPECRAPDNGCEARFHEFLILEFEDAGYGTVHHLTVVTYMLQHSSKLTRAGWLHMRGLLREFLVENKPPEIVRRQNKNKVDSGRRKWKIKSEDGLSKISRNEWTKSILDVRTENPELYCQDVTAWARSTLEESENISEI